MDEFNHNEYRRRQHVLASLRAFVADRDTTENQIQRLIGSEYWLFGNQYIGCHLKRAGMPLDQHDIPLVCSDRSIHVFELKRPGSRIVKRQRNHWVVSADVHYAASQCMNYLRTMDEHGAGIQTNHQNELGVDYDYRRAQGRVVIGHPMHTDDVTAKQIAQTIRSYNAHLARVQVQTYADLIDSAERSLTFDDGTPS